MTHKLIKTDKYLLVVDDSEIIVGDILYDNDLKIVLLWQNYLPSHQLISKQKIIAHLPLNGAPVLEGVPLLPPTEYDVEQLAKEYELKITPDLHAYYGFIDGYNKALEKYNLTLEKLLDLYINETGYGMDMWSKEENATMNTISKIIQSLSQYPTEFECEMESGLPPYNIYTETNVRKTTTNAQGQRVWVGKYL